MNRTVAFVALASVGVVVLAGSALLAWQEGGSGAAERFGRDALTILSLLGVAGGLVYQQGKTGDMVEQVQKQTNGTLTRIMDERDAALAELAATRELLAAERAEVPPPSLATGTVPTYTPDHAEDGTISP